MAVGQKRSSKLKFEFALRKLSHCLPLRPLSRLLCNGIQVLALVLLEQIIIQFDLFKKCVLRKGFSFDISIKLAF